MSLVVPSASAPILDERLPVTHATLLLALLLPCVVLLLVLHCITLFLKLRGYRRKCRRRRRLRSTVSQSSDSGVQQDEDYKVSETPSFPNHESVPPPGPGPGAGHVLPASAFNTLQQPPSRQSGPAGRTYKPDGTAGDGSASFRPPSTILAAMSTTASTTRAELPQRASAYTHSSAEWRRALMQGIQVGSSDSEVERAQRVPPNSPAVPLPLPPPHRDKPKRRGMRRSSTMSLQNERHIVIMSPVDSIRFEYASSIPHEETQFINSGNASTLGPGLDSDFGASAGISLRILSSDSEGCANALWASGLEWDYYDPNYKKRNHMLKQMHHQLPAVCTKQYWV
ncbi:protein huluwa [Polypterus senegalus]|uniref:protein huluwa n=1 Tax=Polypterus senegalus TaxID=55291 RepID=UPI001966961F|nr:protein huluwa [Polypterus senegalus]